MSDSSKTDETIVDILVVEDEDGLREVLLESLEMENFTVRGAANGRAGIEALEAGLSPALVLCDINMPYMNGLEFLRKALVMRPQLRIIMLTAHDDSEKIMDALRLGATDYITKPFRRPELVESIYRVLEIAQVASGEKLSNLTPERRRHFENLLRIRNANAKKAG